MSSLAQHAQDIAHAYQPPAVGRPSLISSESTVSQFLEAVGEGNYIETACKLAGLSKQSVYEWIKRGHAGEVAFAEFANAVEKAEARAEAHLVGLQRKAAEAGPQYWAAAATQLERRHPDRWSKRLDDSSAPKVIVQIGVGQGDVKIGIINPTFAPPTHAVSLCETQLTDTNGSNNNELCYLTSAQGSVTPAEVAIGDSPQPDRQGDPTPAVGADTVPCSAPRRKGPLGRRKVKRAVKA